MSGYTPGPWNVCVDRRGDHMSIGAPSIAGGGSVCILPEIVCDNRAANARLIAASPCLLKELKHLVGLLQPLEQSGALNVPGLATLNGARAALAKAGVTL